MCWIGHAILANLFPGPFELSQARNSLNINFTSKDISWDINDNFYPEKVESNAHYYESITNQFNLIKNKLI